MKQQFIEIGKIIKSLGTKGELRIDIENDIYRDIKNCGHVFILINGDYVPFFIEKIEDQGQYVIKVEEVDNPQHALSLNGKQLYLRDKDIRSTKQKKKQKKLTLENFQVIVSDNIIGTIEKIETYPQQLMATIQLLNESTILIPLVDDWITEIDDVNQTITMDLPEGLL